MCGEAARLRWKSWVLALLSLRGALRSQGELRRITCVCHTCDVRMRAPTPVLSAAAVHLSTHGDPCFARASLL